MSERRILFRGGTTELVLPVTPQRYQVEKGVNVEVVNIHELGDAILMGYGTLATINFQFLLPANPYPFARDDEPDAVLEQLQAWIDEKNRLRFIVSGTGINLPVMLQSLTWGEEDGTNDVTCTLILREHRQLEAVKVASPAQTGKEREDPQKASSVYTIQLGDYLSVICRRFYGDGSPATYDKLAAYNGISNPHLIFVGKTLKIPQPLS